MKFLLGMGLILLSSASQAEFIGSACDHESQLTYQTDTYYAKELTINRYYANRSDVEQSTLAVFKTDNIDSETYRRLEAMVGDIPYGQYYETRNTTYVLVHSFTGVLYVFEKNADSRNETYKLTASSKKCRDSLNPFALKFDAYDLPISTLVMMNKSFSFTNSDDTGVGSTSYIFKGGNAKIDYCRFEKQEKDAAPIKAGQIFEVASVEKNYYRADENTKLLEIDFKSEHFGTISCFSRDNVLKFTIGEVFSALKSNGVLLQLPNYLPEDLASDNLGNNPSLRLINPITIGAGRQQVKIGGSYGKIQSCFYHMPENTSETKTITTLESVKFAKDYSSSYRGNNGEEIEYSGVDLRLNNGDSLFCVSVDHYRYKLTIHDFLRALNADKPNISVSSF